MADLRPSGWERWSHCPGSVEAEAGLPDTVSTYADEGTAAHAVFSNVVIKRWVNRVSTPDTPHNYIGKQINVADEGEEPRHVTVTSEMADEVQKVVEYVQGVIAEMSLYGPVTVRSEQRVDPSPVLGGPRADGTADLILVSDYELRVIDLKYGRGVAVEVTDDDGINGQLGLYMLGALCEYGYPDKLTIPAFKLTVAQPRAWHPDGPFRTVTLTRADVDAFVERARAAAQAATTPGAPRRASEEACRWCKAKATCAEALGAVSQALDAPRLDTLSAEEMFATVDVRTLSPEQIVRVLRAEDFVTGFLKAVHEHAHALLKSGNAPPELAAAYKLVAGTSRRRWIEEPEESILKAIQAIRWEDALTGKTSSLKKGELTETRLRSPAQIEKLIKKLEKQGLLNATQIEAFYRLVEKPEGALKMVPITDDRASARPATVDEMFPDER